MKWNWQQKNWPAFSYDEKELNNLESEFLHKTGIFLGTLKHINNEEKDELIVQLISNEALKTSRIEGEILNRESLQSSIRKNFGLKTQGNKGTPAEEGISEMMVDVYSSFNNQLKHKTLFSWNKMLIRGRNDIKDIGRYRTADESMQVVSGYLHKHKIHFEAPPSKEMKDQMNRFIKWFNGSAPKEKFSISALTRSGIAHLYFVSIHPFEDGNGRIARAISEKSLSQNLGQPTLIALAHSIEKKRKIYYQMLEKSNKKLDITNWLVYFANTVIEAQIYSQKLIEFLINKARFYGQIHNQLNPRQEKVLNRIFEEGIEGFKGGLSAKNYISITGTSRATATRDLQDLINKKALIKKGELRYTRYYLNLEKQL